MCMDQEMGLFLDGCMNNLKIEGVKNRAKAVWVSSLWLVLILAGCRSHNAALLDAVEKQEVGNVKRLLDAGAKADVVPDGGTMFPIEAAAKGGNPTIVRLLLAAGAQPDSAKGAETPLWWAMLNGHEEAAVMLVDAKAKFEGPVRQGITPFYFAVMSDYADLVTKMVAHGADVHASGPQGSPLHEAAENGNLALVRLLVSTGAEINRINDVAETPIFLAVQQGRWEVVEWMATHGADINAKNRLGQTVLHDLATKEDSMAVLKVCALKGDPDIQNLLGETPLHIAAAKGNTIVARALIEDCHANLNLHDHHDLSPAGLAYRQGQTEMVEFLTARGGRLR